MPPIPPSTWKIASVLSVGMLAIATAAILIRCAIATAGVNHPGFSLVIAASRLGLASILLVFQFAIRPQRIPWENHRAIGYTIGAGLALALHFAAWITSLSYTSITASTVLVTTTPIWTTIFCRLVLKESVTRWTGLGIGMAFGGSLLIATDRIANSNYASPLLGNGLALGGALMATTYLLLGRSAQRQGLATNSYILLAYSMAAIILLPLPLITGTSYFGYPTITYLWFLLLAIIPQLIGHTCFNWAMRFATPSLVTITILAEPIGASLLGFLIFQEVPTQQTIQGSIVILIGIICASLSQSQTGTS